jgi:hypothetical protein
VRCLWQVWGHLEAVIQRIHQFEVVYGDLSQRMQRNRIEEIGLVDVVVPVILQLKKAALLDWILTAAMEFPLLLSRFCCMSPWSY